MPEDINQDPSLAKEGVKPKKKRTAKKTTPRANKPSWEEAPLPAPAKEIDTCLNSIYQDNNGKLPDMKTIKIKRTHPVANFFSKLIGWGVVVAALAWVVWYIAPTISNNQKPNLTIQIAGPLEPKLGETNTYTINYRNAGSEPLENVSVQLTYPESFTISESAPAATNPKKSEWAVGTVSPKSAGTITLKGYYFGIPERSPDWRVSAGYRPSNFNSLLRQDASLSPRPVGTPFALSLSGPNTLSENSEVAYVFTVAATASGWDTPLELAPLPGSGFTITSSSPALVKNAKWVIPAALATGSTSNPANLVFSLRGHWSNLTTSSALMKGALTSAPSGATTKGTLATAEIESVVTKNAVNLQLAINGSTTDLTAAPGETLSATIQVTNATEQDITNGTLSLIFVAPSAKRQSILNWPEIKDAADGDIQGIQLSETRRQGKITWNAKHLPKLSRLKPGEKITVDLSLPIRDGSHLDLLSFTESTVTATALVSFSDGGTAPNISTAPLTITLASDLSFESRRSTNGDKQDFTWVIKNTFHELKNIAITATAFGDIAWEAGLKPTVGEISFNPADKKITWLINALPTDVDVASAPFSIKINKTNPTQSTLISKVTIKAEDKITNQTIELTGEETPFP